MLSKKHFGPKRIIIAERFRFHRREQAVGETIADYEAELRRLAIHCEFQEYLDQALRDRLVCGLKSEATQKRLLSEPNLTPKRAIEVAQSMEAAERNTQQLKGGEVSVHSVESATISERKGEVECYRCGRRNHSHRECRFKEADCHNCGRKGHIARMCRSKRVASKGKMPKKQAYGGRHRAQWVQADQESESADDSPDDFAVYKVGSCAARPITAQLKINGVQLTMEVDTGAAVSIISERTQKKAFPKASLQKTTVKLRTYTEEPMSVLGEMQVDVTYQQSTHVLTLYVVQGIGPTLLGRNWLQYIRLDWRSLGIATVQEVPSPADALLKKYEAVFQEGVTTMRSFKANLQLKSDVVPRFHRPRPVPFALREAVGQELDRMEASGVLERVSHSNWAAPIVPVPKKDGQIRICGDFKVTVNPVLQVDQYPLPKPDDLFTTLVGGQKFTKMDLKQAYQQMQLEEEAKELVTINTHKGLYRFNRLPFGIASAPALFQRAMDTILQGIPHVICYIDDILITGSTEEEHLRNLEEVLKRLQHHGVLLKASKCAFLQDSVEYLGHIVDKKGLHTMFQKVEAVKLAPVPKNQQDLRSFLGLVHYYGKFIPNLASLLQPLNELLKARNVWKWSSECEQAFIAAKEKLSQAPVLAHFDPAVPLRLAGDASAFGVGAVLSHVYPDGTERPIAYGSRTLTPSERNYAQLEKEALSLVFGIRKFHPYLYGREFQLFTDHKPLTTILGPKTGIPSLAAARLQRWALILSAYKYQIQFRPTKAHGNADGLSRLSLKNGMGSNSVPVSTVFNIHQLAALPVTSRQIAEATRRHPILSRVLHYTKVGWPAVLTEQTMQPYWSRRNELSVEQGCLLWGIRVIVPVKLQGQVLMELHRSHTGIARMKAVARSYVWWPGLDGDLESLVKSCTKCQSCRSTPAVAPLHPWLWPTQPWQRIHIDYAGPIDGKMMLIVVDAHSKWPEVIEMSSTTSQATIRALRSLFATFGLPQQVVSDNGPQFTSSEFAMFLKNNGVKHIKSSPYHPSTNGLAERFVRTLKNAMRSSDFKEPHQKLMNFLLCYRTTPHSNTNELPCELFLQRKLQTRLDLLRPDLTITISQKQANQKDGHDSHSRRREFFVGQRVMARNLRDGPRWVLGTVVERRGPLSYLVQVATGVLWRRHIDHLLETADSPQEETAEQNATPDLGNPVSYSPPLTPPGDVPAVVPATESPSTLTETAALSDNQELAQESSNSSPITTPPPRRYPQRVRKPPDRFQS